MIRHLLLAAVVLVLGVSLNLSAQDKKPKPRVTTICKLGPDSLEQPGAPRGEVFDGRQK